VTAREVVVTSTGWPDFVFSEEYALMPLDEVAQRIREQRHLPGIPSAREVSADGVAVGDMVERLLQKLEELTLYVIDQHQRIEALERENARLAPRTAPEGMER